MNMEENKTSVEKQEEEVSYSAENFANGLSIAIIVIVCIVALFDFCMFGLVDKYKYLSEKEINWAVIGNIIEMLFYALGFRAIVVLLISISKSLKKKIK